MIKLSNSATNLTPWQYIELIESYVTLTRKQNVFYETLGLGVVMCFSFYSVTAIQRATAATPGH